MNAPDYPETLLSPHMDLDDLKPLIHPDHRIISLEWGWPLRQIFERTVHEYHLDPDHEFKIVRFDSRRVDPGTPAARLALANEIGIADAAVYEEASAVPGFIFYGAGVIDDAGFATSLCGWESWESASVAGDLTAHRAARRRTQEFYANNIHFGRYLLRLDASSPSGVDLKHLHNHRDISRRGPSALAGATV